MGYGHFDGDASVRRSEVASGGLLGCRPISHWSRVGTTEFDWPRSTLTQRAHAYLKSTEAVAATCPNDAKAQIADIAPLASQTMATRSAKGGTKMSPSTTDKIALFIDGANLYATAKTLGFNIDYKRLLKEFQSRGTLLRAFYYTAIIEDQEYSSIRPLIDWLDYNGYSVVTKATKEFIDASGRRKVKANMDIELAVNAMEFAEHIDQMVLFSGDGDFRSLLEAVQRRGVRVTVISTIASQPPMIADELRRQADVFTDLCRAAVQARPRPVRTPRPARS
ncbi:uncharacterized LabA/DUF88 family protein [Bradyrhizobium sp. F1.13.4]